MPVRFDPSSDQLRKMSDEPLADYTGLENLEVMAEAKNYNAFLLGLAVSCARKADQIVDFGAGTGTFARPMNRLGYSIICVEPDENLVARLHASGLESSTLGGTPTTPTSECPESSRTLNVKRQACGPLGTSRRPPVSN
jgi:hypothetical protein